LDATELLSRVESALGSKLLEKGRFGRAGVACAWVEWKGLDAAAKILRDSPELSFDWLENLVVMQLDDSLVMTLFLGQSAGSAQLVVRASAELKKRDLKIEAPSLSEIWPTSVSFEKENAALFGVLFGDNTSTNTVFHLRKGNA
jgi:hypothetical protein